MSRAAAERLAAAVALAVATSVGAATITIVNDNAAGVGFDDPTPVAPVGGNPGTTLGAQRLNAFTFAADIWAAQLASPIPIVVDAEMTDLMCSSSHAVLGQAGPIHVYEDFPGALAAHTWYPKALADKLSGTDLEPGTDDIHAQFNSAIGTTCAFPKPWYYGLDASPPGSDIDFVSVVLHELGHGLGFLTAVSQNGAKLLGDDDTFMLNLEDHDLALLWPPMSDAQRATSSIDTGDLHWVGPAVVANGGVLTAGRDPVSGHVQMFAPNPYQPGSSVSHFDTACSPNQLMEPVYTGPLHSTGLTRDVLDDIGWGPNLCGNGIIDAGEDCDPPTPGGCCAADCRYAQTGAPCEDGDACTTPDTCDGAGTCNPGGPNACDDDNVCTADSCVSPTGCVHTPVAGSCDDGDPCTVGDTCGGGVCQPGTSFPCPLCNVCDGSGGCLALPRTGCKTPTKSAKAQLQIKDKTPNTGDAVTFKWLSGAATTTQQFGHPLTTDDYALCVWDESGAPARIFQMHAPSGLCGGLTCWKPTGTTGFKYTNKTRLPDGTGSVVLKAGVDGKAKTMVKGNGVNLVGVPTAPLGVPLVAQIQGGNGACFEATFSAPTLNAGGQYKAKGD
jgi:hypothetical protein